MPEPTPTLDYAPPPKRRPRASVGVVLMYAALLTALLQLVLTHAGDDAPMRASTNSWSSSADVEAQLKLADADPNPAEIHFAGSALQPFSPETAIRFARVYYAAQYLRYPHRLLVGKDDQIINNQDQLLAADQLPPTQWMKQRNVSAIYRVYDAGLIGPQMEVHPLR
jgi:hypothetical protein